MWSEEKAPEKKILSGIRILTEADLRRCAKLDLEALETVASAFTWLQEKEVAMPPVQHITVSGSDAGNKSLLGDVDIKSAFVPGLDRFAIKIASGFFGNARLGLPTGSGLMVVLDTQTGFCKAVLLDNGYLTDLRTALAGAVAARHLAPRQTDVAGILGTGRQAELQALALHLVRPFERLLIYGRNPDSALGLAARLRGSLADVDIEAVGSAQALVEQSQCLVTTTASREPIIQADWLHPNLHITAVGSDLPGKQELEAEVLIRADFSVFDRRTQCERLGELQHIPLDQRRGLRSCELGEVTSRKHPGRTHPDQITVCDLTGTGVQDTAIAVFSLAKAESLGLGSWIES